MASRNDMSALRVLPWNQADKHPVRTNATIARSIETEWHGKRFRSRLEARWAVVFEAMCIEWEYEPEGFEFDDGTRYLPDFLLHGIVGRGSSDVYVEVKGRMTAEDYGKVVALSKSKPVYIVGDIPCGVLSTERDMSQWYADMESSCYKWPYPYNFETVDGDHFGAFLGVAMSGEAELFGDDSNYLADANDVASSLPYLIASKCRFEHGERPEDDPLFEACTELVSALRMVEELKSSRTMLDHKKS